MNIKELIKEYDMWHEKQMEVLKEHKERLLRLTDIVYNASNEQRDTSKQG